MLGWAIAFFVAAIIVALLRAGRSRNYICCYCESIVLGVSGWLCLQPGNAFFAEPRLGFAALRYSTTRESPSRRVTRSRSRNSRSGMAYLREIPVQSLNSGTAKRAPFFFASSSRSDWIAEA